MNATDSKTDATSRAVRRLRTTLLAFSVALAVPFFLLFAKAYEQLEAEAFLTHRLRAETLVEQVNERAQTLLDLEDNRPVEHYNFFIVERNQLLKNSALTTSPLAQFPPQSSIPGLVGYFQITPDGKFETPTVPDFDAADDPRIIQAALSPDELQRRIKHRDMLRQLLIPKKVVQTAADQFFSDVSRPAPQAARALGKQAFNPAAEQMLEAPQAPQALVDALRDSEQTKKTAAAGLSYEKLEQLNIDTRPFQKGAAESASLNALSSKISPIQDALSAERRQRKQVVSFPSKEQVSGYFRNKSAPKIAAPVPEADSSFEVASASTVANLDRVPGRTSTDELSTVREETLIATKADRNSASSEALLSFESTVDPLRMKLVNQQQFVFYRRVLRDNKRYIQGFVVEREKLLEYILSSQFQSSPLASVTQLIVAYGENILASDGVQAPNSSKKQILLYRTHLLAPLEDLALALSSASLPLGPGRLFLNGLSIAIFAIVVLGLFGIYRLSAAQIALAQQRSDFVSAVSHELKTPLTSIRMYAEMLRDGVAATDENKKSSYYQYILSESERLSRLIENVLQLARLSKSSNSLNLASYSTTQLLDGARQKIEQSVRRAGFELRICNECADGQLTVDEDAFYQIVINLADNALKFSRDAETKVIELGVRRNADQHMMLFVRDFGPGVERNQMKKIFELFYRSEDELTRVTKGTGIGLALVHDLATRMRGTASVRNREPGAEFQVIF